MVFLYIDPGAGSLLIQALIGSMLAIPFFFRSAISRGLARLRGTGLSSRHSAGERDDPS